MFSLDINTAIIFTLALIAFSLLIANLTKRRLKQHIKILPFICFFYLANILGYILVLFSESFKGTIEFLFAFLLFLTAYLFLLKSFSVFVKEDINKYYYFLIAIFFVPFIIYFSTIYYSLIMLVFISSVLMIVIHIIIAILFKHNDVINCKFLCYLNYTAIIT